MRGYRTVSFEAACVLAGTPPWDLDAGVLAEGYWRKAAIISAGRFPVSEEISRWRQLDRQGLLRDWKQRLDGPSAGHRTIEAIRPVLDRWVERKHGQLTYHVVQILTGHGCFGRYLCNVAGREPSSVCHFCGSLEDTAQHTLADCPEWSEPRAQLAAIIGSDLSLPAVVNAMVGNDSSWQAVSTFCQRVMLQKEAAERRREDDVSSHPMRRKRVGRRRLAYERSLPP